jgi:hypothetical protein
VIGRAPRVAVLTAATLALGLALTGCGKLDAGPGSAPHDSPAAGGTSTSAAPSTPAADDSATLDGITQDLDSAGAANTEADSNTQAGDQAAASSDEP